MFQERRGRLVLFGQGSISGVRQLEKLSEPVKYESFPHVIMAVEAGVLKVVRHYQLIPTLTSHMVSHHGGRSCWSPSWTLPPQAATRRDSDRVERWRRLL